jgi:hypothetical protein
MSLQQLGERLGDVERRLITLEEGMSSLAYPEPIAFSLARERSSVLFHEKFFNVLDAGEACLRYTAALALAIIRGAAEHADLVKRLRDQPVALGTWAGVIRDSLSLIHREEPGVALAVQQSLIESLLRTGGKTTPAGRFLLSELVEIRNAERGHASARPEGVYEGLYHRHAPAIHDSLSALGFLRFPMVRIDDIDLAGRYMRYSVRVLMGPSPMGRIDRVVSPSRVGKGDTCVWDGAETILSLGRLVTYRICPACDLEHTFFLDQVTKDESKYHSYAGNHRLNAPPFEWGMTSAPGERSGGA